MLPQIEEVITSWKALSQESESLAGWRGINVSPIGSCEMVAARRFPGNEEALLVRLSSLNIGFSERLPEGKGFEVLKADPFGDSKCWIAVTRKEFGSTDLFTEMITDVIGIIHGVAEEKDEVIFGAILKRIRMWQQFMSNSNGPLSSEAQLGLVGELHFLKILLQFEIPPAVVLKSWVGPEDSPQDFLLGDGAIEIKATMSSSGFPVKIGNLEQLDDAIFSPLFLGAARFVSSKDGLTLPDIISEIKFFLKDDAGSVCLFFDRLLCAGYIESHASYYERKFELNDFRFFSICEGFPRMTSGSVPLGILRAMYEINLDHAKNFLVELDVVLKKLGVVG